MITMTGMIISLLRGTMVIKNEKPKSKNKRRTFTHCLAPIKVLELVYVGGRKTRNRKIVEINMDLFVSDDWIQKIFWPQRIKNKDVYCQAIFF